MLSPFHSFNLSGLVVLTFIMLMFSSNLLKPCLLMSEMALMKSYFKMVLIILLGLFNMSGLIPYGITFTVYIWVGLLVSLTLWSTTCLSGFFKDMKMFLKQLLPLGSPFFLWNFLISLELLSQFIRPLTLSLRLSCNLMAGHVLMSLASNLGVISYFLLSILILFEVAVSIVQSLVYSILTDIYKKESSD